LPTVLRVGPYRFFFYSNEGVERAHIHVRSGDGEAKFWLDPVEEAWHRGYHTRQLKQVEGHINDNHSLLVEAWDEFFGGTQDGEDE
jgi:hypothetical protein